MNLSHTPIGKRQQKSGTEGIEPQHRRRSVDKADDAALPGYLRKEIEHEQL